MKDNLPVYVTGLGAVTPFGTGVPLLWENIVSGSSSIRRVDDIIDLSGIKTKLGSLVLDFDPKDWFNRKRAHRLGRPSQFAIVAAREALDDADWEWSPGSYTENVGVVTGTGIGNINPLIDSQEEMVDRGPRKVSPFLIPQLMPNA